MARRGIRLGAGALALALAAAQALPAAAAAGPPYPAATPKGRYAAMEKLPDWGGVWTLEPRPGGPPPPPALKGAYLDRYRLAKAKADANDGEFPRQASYCTPPGVPYQMGVAQYPIEFLFTPGRVTMLFEAWMQVRRVFTDGRGHPDELEASLYGHSTGRWEGVALVIDTVGLKPGALISPGMGHSDKERITERIQLSPADPDLLLDELTITDPEALERPWTATYRYRRHRDWELLEFACAENDRNPIGENGTAEFRP